VHTWGLTSYLLKGSSLAEVLGPYFKTGSSLAEVLGPYFKTGSFLVEVLGPYFKTGMDAYTLLEHWRYCFKD